MPSIIDYTFQQHVEINESLAFSLCFAFNGGYMTIGGYNKDKHLNGSKTQVVPYIPRGGQYVINVYGAQVHYHF